MWELPFNDRHHRIKSHCGHKIAIIAVCKVPKTVIMKLLTAEQWGISPRLASLVISLLRSRVARY